MFRSEVNYKQTLKEIGRGGVWDECETEPVVLSKWPANRISTELTAGEEFDYKLIKSNVCQVCVIILFDIDFLNKNERNLKKLLSQVWTKETTL